MISIKKKISKKIDSFSYANCMSLMSTDGGMAFQPETCKEVVYTTVGWAKGFNHSKKLVYDMMLAGDGDKKICFRRNTIIFYVNEDSKYTTAKRIGRVLSLLADKHDVKQPKIKVYENSTALLIKVDKFYFSNPVAVSGVLTFIRAASNTSFIFKGLNDFITKSIKYGTNTNDGGQLNASKKNGNLNGFLNKSLKILKMKPKKAFTIGIRGSDSPYDGIVRWKDDSIGSKYMDISKGVFAYGDHHDHDDHDDYFVDDYDEDDGWDDGY